MVKYNIATKVIINHIKAHSSAINCIKFVPLTNDSKIITGSSDDTLRVWDLNGNELKLLGGHFGSILDLDFHIIENRKILATASEDRSVLIWDYDNSTILTNLIESKNSVRTVKFAEQFLITGSKDKYLRIYDIKSEKLIYEIEIGAVTSLVVHPTKNYCFAGTTSNHIFIIDYISGKITNKIRAHDLPIQGLDISSNLLVSSSLGRMENVKIWNISNLPSEIEELTSFEAHNSSVSTVKFLPGKDSIGTGGFDRSVKIFSPGSMSPSKTLRGSKLAVTDIDWSEDGNLIAYSSADGSFRIFDVGENKLLVEKDQTRKYISSLFVLNSNNEIIAGFGDGSIKVLSIDNLEILRNKDNAHKAPITKIVYFSEKNALLSVSEDKFIKLWDMDSLELLAIGEGHTMGIKDVVILNESIAITVSSDSQIKKWDLVNLENVDSVTTHEFSVNSIVLGNKNEFIATSSNDKKIVIHNTDLKPKFTYLGHKDSVLCACFSKNDKWLLTGSRCGEIFIFDVQTEQILTSLDIHTGEILKMSFSEDFSYFCVISADHNLSLFSYEENSESFNLKNIYYNSFPGKPIDFCWKQNNQPKKSISILVSTFLGELIELVVSSIISEEEEEEIVIVEEIPIEEEIKEPKPVLIVESVRKSTKKKVASKKASKKTPTKKKTTSKKKVASKKASKKTPAKKKTTSKKKVASKKASKKAPAKKKATTKKKAPAKKKATTKKKAPTKKASKKTPTKKKTTIKKSSKKKPPKKSSKKTTTKI